MQNILISLICTLLIGFDDLAVHLSVHFDLIYLVLLHFSNLIRLYYYYTSENVYKQHQNRLIPVKFV